MKESTKIYFKFWEQASELSNLSIYKDKVCGYRDGKKICLLKEDLIPGCRQGDVEVLNYIKENNNIIV